ncbi:MAG TPA: hypothetical protein DIW44_16515 [Anaerolineaceae bacterium]|nr:hypothetical protein [Anaerolineaceae bacterium]
MKRMTKFLTPIFICVLLFASFSTPVQADGETITASGQMCSQGICNNIYITFPPNGGPINGTLSGEGNKDGCLFKNSGTLSGTFAGGDGGAVNGVVSWTMTASCGGNSISDTWGGTWEGAFYADGTGKGSGIVKSASGNWTVSFSADEFQRITTPITKEYFKATYGIDVVDGTTQWTDRELRLLDDLFKKLPKSYWDKTKFTRIERNSVKIDSVTKAEKPNVFGDYAYWNRTIRVFDHANSPFDFEDDPNGDKQFIGTIVHEMTHAYHFYKDYKSVYESSVENDNSLLMTAFRENSRDDSKDFRTGWAWKPIDKKWVFKGAAEENKPISDYAKDVDPHEDLCESVMFYVVDPASLAAKSPNRYQFIKDSIFNGVEYPWDY